MHAEMQRHASPGYDATGMHRWPLFQGRTTSPTRRLHYSHNEVRLHKLNFHRSEARFFHVHDSSCVSLVRPSQEVRTQDDMEPYTHHWAPVYTLGPLTASRRFVQGPRASLRALVHIPSGVAHWVDHFSAINGSAGVAFKVKQARDTDRNVSLGGFEARRGGAALYRSAGILGATRER